jgi:phosphate transport system substrate-binding protein
MKFKATVAVLSLISGLASAAVHAAVDHALPDYKSASGVTGNFSSVGSDTLNNLMTLWAEEFKRTYPNVNIQIQGAGSSTAPPALTEGTANFGPMSRLMKDQEVQAFEQKFGYKPTAIGVAIDALAVFVNKDNPIKGLSIPQVDGIFSATRKCGGKDAKRWGDLGLDGDWKSKPIQLYGRNSVSGTYGYFKEHALCKGDFKNNVNEQPGSASVVQSVATGLNAIGYSGIGYKTSGVRALPLSAKDGGQFEEATEENAISGKYPLARVLYVYVNKAPNKPLSPMELEFLKMVLSKQGQQVVEKDGYIALPAKLAERELGKVTK